MTVEPLSGQDDWLARFHAGERRVMEECYREHFGIVDGAVGQMLSAADQ
ncbi:MAG: hypothetical protein V2A73_06735 [Pseudomonadota bacterium]